LVRRAHIDNGRLVREEGPRYRALPLNFDASPATLRDGAAAWLAETVDNPYDSVYWLARMFVNSDQYGGIARGTQFVEELAAAVERALQRSAMLPEAEALPVLQGAVRDLLLRRRTGTSTYKAVERLCEDLAARLITREHFKALALTLRHVIAPVNRALEQIPSDDRVYAERLATELLQQKGEAGVKDVMILWDTLGAQGCLAAERVQVVRAFARVRTHIEQLVPDRSNQDLILTAFVQEFERRLGQKRKRRGGQSLEDVTGFICAFFGIQASEVPEHITAKIELDKMVYNRSGRHAIGISCKRTIRERWKQTHTSNVELLETLGISQLWQVLVYDRDLSDEKIETMGRYNWIFYLPDESEKFGSAQRNPRLARYVRPLSRFVRNLREFVLSD
jgi:hypothetical protein